MFRKQRYVTVTLYCIGKFQVEKLFYYTQGARNHATKHRSVSCRFSYSRY